MLASRNAGDYLRFDLAGMFDFSHSATRSRRLFLNPATGTPRG